MSKRTTFTEHLNAFRTEALMLLRYQFAFIRIKAFKDLNETSRSDLVDRLIALKTIENDLVIRVCKFDDDTKGTHSFKRAIREINSTHRNKKQIDMLVASFSKYIEPLKKVRRHTQLAHLKIGAKDDDYEVRYDFTETIKYIVEIIDLMGEEKHNYTWSDGRYEKFDLRKEVLSELKT